MTTPASRTDDRAQLQADFAAHLLEGMGTRELETFFLEAMADNLDRLSDSELFQEVNAYAPELLEPEA